MLAGLHGSYLKFARTEAERRKSNDPRPSIRERYPTREAYLSQVKQAVRQPQKEDFLLETDAQEMLKIAAQRKLWDK